MGYDDKRFAGVGKARSQQEQGVDRGSGQLNIEHEPEGVELAEIALAKERTAQAVLRVNPDVDAGTHAKISTGKAEDKFGVGIDVAPEIVARLAGLPGLKMRGIALHIGRSEARRVGKECVS